MAYETIMAIAFPEDKAKPYSPPERPKDGSKLSRLDLIQRDVYNQWHSAIENGVDRNGMKRKDSKRIASGRKGAMKRWGDSYAESQESCIDEDNNLVLLEEPAAHASPSPMPNPSMSTPKDSQSPKPPLGMPGDDFTGGVANEGWKHESPLTDEEKKKIAEYRRKFPNAESLKTWIEKNWYFQDKQAALDDNFVAHAFQLLDEESNWCSSRDHRPIKSIAYALHWILQSFKRRTHEIQIVEKKIAEEDRQVDLEIKASAARLQSPSEIAAFQSFQRREAERKAFEMHLRGEL